MIGLIDYGLSNLACVQSAINYLGYKSIVIKKHNEFKNISKIILPGVGAFGDAIKNLKKREILDQLNETVVGKKKAFLGICLGAQLICKSSEEFGFHEGLGWVDAKVKKIKTTDENLRIPHVGWNNINVLKKNILFKNIPDESLFYFTHSFAIFTDKDSVSLAECEHSEKFSAAVNVENIFAVQFHPEKSQKMGLKLLKNFLDL